MQTRTYGDLFKITSALIGTGGELDVSEQDQVSHFINRRFQQAFDESPVWPRYLVSSEERALSAYKLSGATGSTTTSVNQNYKFLGLAAASSITTGGTKVYNGLTTSNVLIYKNQNNAWIVATAVTNSVNSAGVVTIVNDGQSGVQFTEADTVKNDSIENVKTWTPRSGSDILKVLAQNLIPYTELTLDSIGDFNRIHRKRAFMNDSSLEYDFFVDFNGANILNIANSTDNEAFVSYKKQFTPFTVTSDYYNSVVEVPGEFFNYIAHSVYADFLRVQNRQEQALAEEQVAQTYLALELEKIDIRSNNNTINKRFSTYVNRQAR
jgi:hypothetical protein